MSTSLVSSMIPKNVRKAIIAIPVVGLVAEAAGVAVQGSTLLALRRAATSFTTAGLIIETSIAVAAHLNSDGEDGLVSGLSELLTR